MALSAFAVRSGEETRQMQVVCLDDLVPADDELRRIEALVDWEQVRRTAAPFYKPGGVGRMGLDPAVLVKLALVLAWRGLPSMRQTLRVARTDMSIRWFLGYGLTERLPDHSTFSVAQTKRFADSSVFEQLFTQVLRACTGAGLVGGRRLVVDGTHIEADAALKSLRAELSVVEDRDGAACADATPSSGDGDGDGDGDGEIVAGDGAQARPDLRLAAPRTGPTPKRRASNQTAVSRTDPDAKLRHKPGHRKHLVHRGQVAADPKHRVIIAVQAEHATGSEADALQDLITRARFAGHAAAEVAADTGYASESSYATLDKLKTTAFIPPQPAAKHAAAEHARQRMRTQAGQDAAFDRQAHAEGSISELKRHGAGRARCRGTRLLQLQLLAAATAINLKRLITIDPAASQGLAGDPDARNRTILTFVGLFAATLTEIHEILNDERSTGS